MKSTKHKQWFQHKGQCCPSNRKHTQCILVAFALKQTPTIISDVVAWTNTIHEKRMIWKKQEARVLGQTIQVKSSECGVVLQWLCKLHCTIVTNTVVCQFTVNHLSFMFKAMCFHKRHKPSTNNAFSVVFLFDSQFIMWASVRVPSDSVPTTQSPKKELWDYRAIASSQGVLSEGEKRKRVGFDWWMVWMWVWWRVSSTVVLFLFNTLPTAFAFPFKLVPCVLCTTTTWLANH